MIKRKVYIWIFCLAIMIGTVYLAELGTASPHSSNGNGNPFLLVIYMCWPLYICFYYVTINLSFYLFRKINSLLVEIFSVVLCVAALVGSYFAIQSKETSVRSALSHSNNAHYQEGWNQFTNSVYINAYTFIASLLICVLLTLVFRILYRVLKNFQKKTRSI